MGGGAVCGTFIRRGTPVGESSGDEGRDDDGGTHLEGVDWFVSFLFYFVFAFLILISITSDLRERTQS